ncbi:MAG TPA: DNA gyrase C-terminal beta-propeller domain-containing protein, partial [Nitrospiria bacterium]|nr:DNA gyrase C-terminal beta-propeller domain-containing protein [Nitrospiria bacterium]
VVMATRNGVIKKTELSAYSHPRLGGIIAIKLDEGDRLMAADLTDGKKEILIGTQKGLFIRFKEAQVRPIGRAGMGVRGIRLSAGNEVIGMEVLDPKSENTILTITEKGFGKRNQLADYRLQARGGKGIIGIRTAPKSGHAVTAFQVGEDQEVMLITAEGKILRLKIKDIRVIGRSTQGVHLIRLEGDDRVVGVATVAEGDEHDEGAGPEGPKPSKDGDS